MIEELTTARNEYKKVNQFLIDEIELLKKENVYLKSELTKYILNSQSSESNITDNNDKEASVDLTKYIDSDENSDSDDNNLPPLEFTVDS